MTEGQTSVRTYKQKALPNSTSCGLGRCVTSFDTDFLSETFTLLHPYYDANIYFYFISTFWVCPVKNFLGMAANYIIIFRPYLNMEGKSSTQRVFFYIYLTIENVPKPMVLNLKNFYHQIIANLP